MALQKGKRVAAKLRLALTGPTNAGKTYTALRIAYGLIKAVHPEWNDEQIWEHVALIDTERNRGLFYIDRSDLPLPTKAFLHAPLDVPYSPERYMVLLDQAYKAVGPDGVVIIDSLSHAWNYEGGILDLKEEIAKQAGKNSYTAWAEANKPHNRLIDKVMSAPCHTISTMRSKMDYVLEENEKGKMAPKKVGLKPIQRDDTEYEFDITLMLDKDHRATVVKDITFLNQLAFDEIVTEKLGIQIQNWLSKGIDPKVFLEEQRTSIIKELRELLASSAPLLTYYKQIYPDIKTKDLSYDQAKDALRKIKEVM